MYRACEREFCDKLRLNISNSAQTTIPLKTEGWNKKQKMPDNLTKSFQCPPKGKFMYLNDTQKTVRPKTVDAKGECSASKFENKANNCWFNALTQSLLHVECFRKAVVRHTENSTYKNIPWSYAIFLSNIAMHKSSVVRMSEIIPVLEDLSNVFPQLEFQKQNDPMDLVHPTVAWCGDLGLDNELTFRTSYQCETCKDLSFSSVVVNIHQAGDVGELLQLKMKEHFSERLCNICINSGVVIEKTPDILIVTLPRAQMKSVIRKSISCGDVITIDVSQNRPVRYRKKSVICHRGKANHGHYWAVLYDNIMCTKVDDMTIATHNQKSVSVDKSGVVYIFEKHDSQEYSETSQGADGQCDSANNEVALSTKVIVCHFKLLFSLCAAYNRLLTDLGKANQMTHSASLLETQRALKSWSTEALTECAMPLDYEGGIKAIEHALCDTIKATNVLRNSFQVQIIHIISCGHCSYSPVAKVKCCSNLVIRTVQDLQNINLVCCPVETEEVMCSYCGYQCVKEERFTSHLPENLVIAIDSPSGTLEDSVSLCTIFERHIFKLCGVILCLDLLPYFMFIRLDRNTGQWCIGVDAQHVITWEQLVGLVADSASVLLLFNRNSEESVLDLNVYTVDHICTASCKVTRGGTQWCYTTLKGVKISEEDLRCLTDCSAWLNDGIIDNYIAGFISEVGNDRLLGVPATFVSQSLQSLYISNYDWMPSIPNKPRNWWNYDTVVIPVNTAGDHWNCIVMYMETAKQVDGVMYIHVDVMDSLYKINLRTTEHINYLQRYLVCQYVALHGQVINVRFIVTHVSKCKEFVRQDDSSSCGLYVCLFAKKVISGINNITGKSAEMRRTILHDLGM
ncbi:hypothetical protein ACEWY4_016904 [Coilia grayii]|uniref:Ubiquitin-like protease family profile domain-containing protein n=1 Tax=Coilia grayii TaxID=363190 RepID=A0ABD1JLQ6_9TELE